MAGARGGRDGGGHRAPERRDGGGRRDDGDRETPAPGGRDGGGRHAPAPARKDGEERRDGGDREVAARSGRDGGGHRAPALEREDGEERRDGGDRETPARGGRPALPPLARNVAGVLLTLALTFLGLTAVTFVIGRVMPADPVLAIVGDRAPQDVYDAVHRQLGLDRPIPVQYLRYLAQLFRGDLGVSIMTAQPVMDDIARFFPATLELATVATFLGIFAGVPLGVLAAVKQGRWPDHVVRIFGLCGYSAPIFWLGMVALLIFYARLGWVAGPGRLDVFHEDVVASVTGVILLDAALAREWEIFRNAVAHLVLPATILGVYALAYIARMTRAFMLDQLGQEYVLTARVKGVSETAVIWRHAFRNVLVQLITIVGLTYASLLEGSVLTETVFAWPGIGQYITRSLFNNDMNAVLGGTIVVGACFVGINMLCDLLYRLVDPRVR